MTLVHRLTLLFKKKPLGFFLVTFAMIHLIFPFVDPSLMYPNFLPETPSLNGVHFDGFNVGIVLFFSANFLLTMALGYSLSQGFYRDIPVSTLVKILSAFTVGHFTIIGVLRLLTLFFPHGTTYFPSILTQIGIATWFLFPKLKEFQLSNFSRWDGAVLLGFALSTLYYLVLFIWFVDLRIHGHGPGEYIDWYLEILSRPESFHFPIIYQHYGEWLYNYTLTEPIVTKKIAPILPPWFTISVIKSSATLLIYCLFKKMRLDSRTAFLGTFFLMFSTFALNPLKYHFIFDSGTPISFVSESGRFLNIILLFLLFTDLTVNKQPLKNSFAWPFLFLAPIGLASTSFTNPVFILLLTGIALSVKFLLLRKEKSQKDSIARLFQPKISILVVVAAVALPMMTYEIVNFDSINKLLPPGILLLPGIFLLGYICFFSLRPFLIHQFALTKNLCRISPEYLIFTSATILSLFFLGNVLSRNPFNLALIQFLQFFGFAKGISQERLTPHGNMFKGKDFRFFEDLRELYGHYNSYCRGALEFLSTYGLFILFAVGILVFVFYFKRIARVKRISSEQEIENRLNHFMTVFCLSLFPISFFLMDFVNLAGERSWVKSRLLELPLYLVLFIFFVLVGRLKNQLLFFFISILVVIHTVTPYLVAQIHVQLIENARLLWSS